ncbi:hypothetical protein N1030_07060 [Desulfovibrio mangrovi]|uniref:hypothetical protein n=1 Tax=Desulfovibrio mangrovi TaxID=2976983 RepID=UPI0022470F84|nr:hypothetical protein [Desulfovibrio mangrovi]UZP68722.1 hypothetical protein N1030_07060 [Desulfovibrio mangrovi]
MLNTIFTLLSIIVSIIIIDIYASKKDPKYTNIKEMLYAAFLLVISTTRLSYYFQKKILKNHPLKLKSHILSRNNIDVLFSVTLFISYIIYKKEHNIIASSAILYICTLIYILLFNKSNKALSPAIYLPIAHTAVYISTIFTNTHILLIIYLIHRFNEIVIAFTDDINDKLCSKTSSSQITAHERITLAAKSYIEMIFIFSILYSSMEGDITISYIKPIMTSLDNQLTFSIDTLQPIKEEYGTINILKSKLNCIPDIYQDITTLCLIISQRIMTLTLLVTTFTVYNNRAFYELSQKAPREDCKNCMPYNTAKRQCAQNPDNICPFK